MLKEKARYFNRELGGPDSFKASEGWVDRFKKRYEIRQISVQGESLSADTGGAEEFKEEIKKIEEENYDLDNIYNADETGLNVKMLPKKTLATRKEKKAPGHKECKDRVTIMNCANASGTHKIPLLLIGKSLRPRCFKGKSNLPLEYRAQPSSWMSRTSHVEIFDEI